MMTAKKGIAKDRHSDPSCSNQGCAAIPTMDDDGVFSLMNCKTSLTKFSLLSSSMEMDIESSKIHKPIIVKFCPYSCFLFLWGIPISSKRCTSTDGFLG